MHIVAHRLNAHCGASCFCLDRAGNQALVELWLLRGTAARVGDWGIKQGICRPSGVDHGCLLTGLALTWRSTNLFIKPGRTCMGTRCTLRQCTWGRDETLLTHWLTGAERRSMTLDGIGIRAYSCRCVLMGSV